MWERDESIRVINDLSHFHNHADLNITTTGGFEPGVEGPAIHLISDDWVDTGVEEINGIGLFADSTQEWTVIVRYKLTNANSDATIVARAGTNANSRTFQIFNSGTANQDPAIRIRGPARETGWGLDDGEYHTVYVRWDGTTARSSYDGLKGDAAHASVGSAAEETGQRIIFGARTNGTGFFVEDGHIDFVHILRGAMTDTQILKFEANHYGPFRMRDEAGVVYALPAVGGVTLPIFDKHYRQMRAA